MTASLSAKDFRFRVNEKLELPGCPLGEDDFFVLPGHEWTDGQVAAFVRLYLTELDSGWPVAEIDALVRDIVDRGAKRIHATPLFLDDDEWALSWSSDGPNEKTIPVTVARLQ